MQSPRRTIRNVYNLFIEVSYYELAIAFDDSAVRGCKHAACAASEKTARILPKAGAEVPSFDAMWTIVGLYKQEGAVPGIVVWIELGTKTFLKG